MSKLFKFQDSILIEPSLTEKVKSDATEMLRRDKNTRLEVVIDATHSGVETNNRVYPGKFVSQGYKSFISKDNGGTADYDKPILRHHDIQDDPIGRVVDAKFTPYKMGDMFEFDYLAPDQMGSKGSGVVTIKAVITDPDAIQKIIDGRYLSVSAGHSSPILLCSVCGDSIKTCTHIPGQSYDETGEEMVADGEGNKCLCITGPLTYHECSFVNLPAQPPAKLLNFNWKDSKETFDNTYITSFVKGKKELVRNFNLFDEDSELSLLNGKLVLPIKKTVIAISPAVADKLKHVLSSDDPKVSDVTSNVRQTKNGSDSGVQDVEQNLDKAKNLEDKSKKDSKMEDKKLETLEVECQSLKDKLATAETKSVDLQKTIEAKDSQIHRLTTDATELQVRVAKNLAVSLASIKVRLKKPGTEGIKSKDDLEAYVAKLATRTPDSLQDSLEDLLLEFAEDSKIETPVVTKTPAVNDLIAKDKVGSPTLSKDSKPELNTKSTNKKADSKTAMDALSESFGLNK